MAENYQVIMLKMGLPLLLFCSTFSNAAAQTVSSCNADSITIKDPVTGSVQCQDCLKCPAGEGLSVNCGDVISSKIPLVCKPCVRGETYSSGYESGACKDCENCRQYRETVQPCTLTSKAVCGKCKLGAYEEPMLGMCKPCSPCCNDGKDIVEPQCQVSGVPTNMQCSFARSVKCSKEVAPANVSTAAPTVETSNSTAQSTIFSSVTSFLVNSVPSEPLATLPYGASAPRTDVIAGSVFGGVFVVFLIPLVFTIRYFVVKRRKARKKVNDLAHVEAEIGERPEQVQDVQSNDQANDGTVHPNLTVASLEKTSVPVQESGTKSKERAGPFQETQQPGHHSNTDFKPPGTVLESRPEPSSELHSHIKVPGRNTTVHVITAVHVTSGDQKPDMV